MSELDPTRPARAERAPDLDAALARLREAFDRDRNPPLEARMDNLDKLERVVTRRREDIAAAVGADFGGRSPHSSTLVEVVMTVEGIRYAKKELKRWMKPRKRRTNLSFLPAKVRLVPQPLGVIGVIAPWNYPVNLALGPLTGALAAGNRVMLKPSELTPRTSELLAAMMQDAFGDDLVATALGDASVGAAFSALPFDHLVFTGSTRVGRLVMKAAAENLTPVTLELGGKSPTIVHASYPVDDAARSVVTAKWFNAGQTCIAPDYVMVPEGQRDAFVAGVESHVRRHYPTMRDNPDYTSVIDASHKARLEGLIDDAESKGAGVHTINPSGDAFDGTNKLPAVVLTGVTDEMKIMQEEIFGPILPVLTYGGLDEAIRYVNDRPRPLALYYFDRDDRRADRVLERTVSGGAAINSCVWHFAQDDLPFGGVGPSGMGRYHAQEGFDTFSHLKPVFEQSRINGSALLEPPYGRTIETLMRVLLRA